MSGTTCCLRCTRAWQAFLDPHYVEADQNNDKQSKQQDREMTDQEKEDGGKLTVSPNMMKLITLITLLVSDFDMLFTITSIVSYYSGPAAAAEPAARSRHRRWQSSG